ncbi:hypothetical protein D3C80_2113050 [compost metagenome]
MADGRGWLARLMEMTQQRANIGVIGQINQRRMATWNEQPRVTMQIPSKHFFD